MDLEDHDPVPDPAQLGALAAVGLTRVRGRDLEVELVRNARHDVPLEEELRDVEGMDDVRALQEQVGRLAGWQNEPALRAGRCRDREERLRIELRVGRKVVEGPLELAGDGPD